MNDGSTPGEGQPPEITANQAPETPANPLAPETPANPLAPETPAKETTAKKEVAPALGAAGGQLAAWALVALSNGILISALAPMPPGRATVRIPHHLFSAGHLLALGLFSYWVVRAAARVLPSRLWARLLAVLALSAAMAAVSTEEDLSNFIAKQTAAGSAIPWRLVFSLGIGVAVAAVAAVGHLLARPWFRWAAVAGGLGAAVWNHFLLPGEYPAFHFFVAWCGAVLAGAALASMRVRRPRGARFATPALAAVTLAAFATLVIRPSNAVWREMWWSPTAVLVPALARFRALTWRDDGRHPLAGSPWLGDRSALPDIPPSRPPLSPTPPHVVFVTIDALRPDLIDNDSRAGVLPELTSLRAESLHFSSAYSPSPSTVTTITSFLTGKYYSQLYWAPMAKGAFKGVIMPDEDPSPRLPKLLAPAGVWSTHVVGLYGLAADAGVGVDFSEEIRARRDYAPAKEMISLAIDSLRRNPDKPHFLYMHLVDPHAPYDRGGTGGKPFDAYLREVALVDKEIGRLRDALRSEGLEDRTILIVSADHGEAFGEHRLNFHATSLYDEMIHVPLLIRAPGVAPRRIEQRVTLMDMGPTILDLYGLPTPATFQGESLLPFLRGEDPQLSRPVAADAGRRIQALYFADGFKAITDLRKGTFELYNLKADPKEKKNVVDTMGDKSTKYISALRAYFKNHTLDRPGYTPPWRQF